MDPPWCPWPRTHPQHCPHGHGVSAAWPPPFPPPPTQPLLGPQPLGTSEPCIPRHTLGVCSQWLPCLRISREPLMTGAASCLQWWPWPGASARKVGVEGTGARSCRSGGWRVRHLPGLCLPCPPPQWGGRAWCCCRDKHGAGEGTRRAVWGSWGAEFWWRCY